MPKKSIKGLGKIALFLLSVLLFSHVVLAQVDREETILAISELQRKADSAYGSDHELLNGDLYYQTNLYAQGTPFYFSKDWIEGKIQINGKLHEDVLLKYNIETDQLISLASIKNGMSAAILVNASFVEFFQLGEQVFYYPKALGIDQVKGNYIHQVYNGGFSFLATYKKIFVSDYTTKTPYGKYTKTDITYFIYENGLLTKISSKKAVLNYFEANKKEIKKYMKDKKMKFKKSTERQWYGLMNMIDNSRNGSK